VLEFSDLPYQFFPPQPNRFVIRLGRWANNQFILRNKNHRISDLRLEGGGQIEELIRSGARVLFLPNHPTHSDPQMMTEIQRRIGTGSYFMAAYDVFLRSKFNARMMQLNGSFSVDREGSDRRAMSTAIDVLKDTGSLTVFPEGNVYFTNDRPTPFLEGAAFVGVKAQKDLGSDVPVYAVPVAIKATHLIDQRTAVLDRLGRAAKSVGSRCDRDADPLLELRRVGQLVLEKNLKVRGFEPPDASHTINDALLQAAENLLDQLETDIGQAAKAGAPLTERMRKVRSHIHKVRINPKSEADINEKTATLWADRAILTLRLLGYAGGYVAEHPTVDRFAETVEKLTEDLQSQSQRPYGKRRGIVRLCDPIDLREHSGRGAIESVTDLVEAAVQTNLDDINAENASPGSRIF